MLGNFDKLRRYWAIDEIPELINMALPTLRSLIVGGNIPVWVRAPDNIEVWLLDRENSQKLVNERLMLHGVNSRCEAKRKKVEQIYNACYLRLSVSDVSLVVDTGSAIVTSFDAALDRDGTQYPETTCQDLRSHLRLAGAGSHLCTVCLVNIETPFDVDDDAPPFGIRLSFSLIGQKALIHEINVEIKDLLISVSSLEEIMNKYVIRDIDSEKFPFDFKNLIVLAGRGKEVLEKTKSSDNIRIDWIESLRKEANNMEWKDGKHKHLALKLLECGGLQGESSPSISLFPDYLNYNIQGLILVFKELWEPWLGKSKDNRPYVKCEDVYNKIREKTKNLTKTQIKQCEAMIRPPDAPRGRPPKNTNASNSVPIKG